MLGLAGVLAADGLLAPAARDAAAAPARCAQAAALRRQGQAGRPPVHERRAVAGRHVRSQAAAGQVRRQAAARPTCAPSARPARRCARRSSSRKYGQSGIEVSELFAKTAAARRRHVRHPLDARRRAQSRAVADADELRRRPAAAAEHGLVGHLRPGHARTRTCPASSPCVPAAIRSWRRRTGESAFLPGAYQGTYIDTQHTDVEKLIENIRNTRHVADRAAAAARPACGSSTSGTCEHAQQRRAARSAHPVVRAGLPHADARRPTRSTSAASRSTSASCTATGMHGRQLLIARRLLERGVRFVQVWSGARPAVGQPRRPRKAAPQAGRRRGTARSPRS